MPVHQIHPVATTAPTEHQAPEPLLTAEQVADYLGVTRQTVYNLMKKGLPSIKVGSARRFRRPAVDGYLNIEATS